MRIADIQTCSLTNYPGKCAAVVFCRGCFLNCPYCYNKELCNHDGPAIPEKVVLDKLTKLSQRGVISGVCITGGDPLYNLNLPDFLSEIRARTALSIKIDCSGHLFDLRAVSECLEYIDYLALDYKTVLRKSEFGRHGELIEPLAFAKFFRHCDGELRTTIFQGADGSWKEDLIAMNQKLRESKVKKLQNMPWFWQKNIYDDIPYSEIEDLRLKMTNPDQIHIRGVLR